MERIESLENATIKRIKKLKTKKYREKEGLFLAEGYKFLDFDYEPKIIVLSEEIIDNEKIIQKVEKKNSRKIVVTKQIFKNISSQENSQGVIAIYPIIKGSIDDISEDIVVLDKVQDPGNLGTIIRVAASSGIRDIIMSVGTCDTYNEKTVRSSMGSIFDINIIYMPEEEIIKTLKEKGYKLLVTALDSKAISYTDMVLDNKNALVFGSEGNGVSKNFLDSADSTVIIPIYGMAESLNVAMASGIMMYKLRELRGA